MDLSWIVVYQDETNLFQYNDDGTENAYSDIDRERLSEFHIIDRDTQRTIYALALDDGQRLIYRKRHMTRGDGQLVATVFMVGWQQKVGNKNIQSVGWIFPDGSIIQTGKFREGHRLFYGIEWMDFEEVDVVKSKELQAQEQETLESANSLTQ